MYLVDVHEIPLSVADRAQSSGKLFQDFLFHTPMLMLTMTDDNINNGNNSLAQLCFNEIYAYAL